MIPASFDGDGFCVIEGVLSGDEVAALQDVVAVGDGRGGMRNLFDVPEMQELAQSQAVRKIVEAVLGPHAKAVRGTLFDKTSAANWKVPWHQDVTIAVSAPVDVEGYGPWSKKAGITHVQPPAEILERMVSVRIHLDDCPEANGALKVVPGSQVEVNHPAMPRHHCCRRAMDKQRSHHERATDLDFTTPRWSRSRRLQVFGLLGSFRSDQFYALYSIEGWPGFSAQVHCRNESGRRRWS